MLLHHTGRETSTVVLVKRLALLALIAVVGSGAGAPPTLVQAAADHPPVYKFTQTHPPLLRDTRGDIYSVPAANLRSEIGKGNWDSADAKTQYRAVHYHRWLLVEFPHRYSTDVSVEVTQTFGYEKTLTDKFTKEIGGEAGGEFFGISAKVTGSLKFEKEAVEQWKQETMVKATKNYKANFTYDTWELVDLVTIDRVSLPEDPKVIPPQSYIADVLAVYEDDTPDSNSAVLNEALNAAFAKTAIEQPTLVDPPFKVVLPTISAIRSPQ